MVNAVTEKPKSLHARIVSGSVVLLSGSGLTMAINFAYNIEVARSLGPSGFSHANVVFTILTLLSAAALAFQIVATKLVAQQPTPASKTAVYRFLHRSAWLCGILVAAALVIFERPIASYLNLPDVALIPLIAIGAAFYIPMGTRRGYLQGTCGFRSLATNMVLEQAVRFGGALALILVGAGVQGVIVANSAAIVAAYYALRVTNSGHVANPLERSDIVREISQAGVYFAGQIVINNCGIVLVNHFFASHIAGVYAAVALVGRVIYSMSQAVMNSTFPLVAGTDEEERRDLRVIATALMLVLAIGTVITLVLCFAPASIWRYLFGAGFETTGKYSISYLLALYAVAMVIYSLSAVMITFEMSYKIANTSYVQLACSGVLIAGICLFHSTLREVVLVHLVLMVILLFLVAVPFLMDSLARPGNLAHGPGDRPFRLIRRVSEDEVIAEFLKSDFRRLEFRPYQSVRGMVSNPNLDDADENAMRRALLFIRHLALWKELPPDTEWYEVEVNELDLNNLRIFPRAQWRQVARGSFSAIDVAEGMRTRKHLLEASFVKKIATISDCLSKGTKDFPALILIGVSEHEPLTVLDGNHRLTAALLTHPSRLKRLRFLCGLSPRMTECCWYNSNLVTLFRYGRNVLTNAVRNPEAELARLLRDAS